MRVSFKAVREDDQHLATDTQPVESQEVVVRRFDALTVVVDTVYPPEQRRVDSVDMTVAKKQGRTVTGIDHLSALGEEEKPKTDSPPFSNSMIMPECLPSGEFVCHAEQLGLIFCFFLPGK